MQIRLTKTPKHLPLITSSLNFITARAARYDTITRCSTFFHLKVLPRYAQPGYKRFPKLSPDKTIAERSRNAHVRLYKNSKNPFPANSLFEFIRSSSHSRARTLSCVALRCVALPASRVLARYVIYRQIKLRRLEVSFLNRPSHTFVHILRFKTSRRCSE